MLAVACAGLLLGSVIPNPKSDVSDVTVSTTAEWHPIRGEWTLTQPVLSVGESKIVSLRAFFSNLLSFTSPSVPIQFTIETTTGTPVDHVEQRTGKGGFFGTERTITAVFREVPPGDYVVRLTISESDSERVEVTRSLRITSEDD